jgi:hypothetical protein
MEIIHYKEKDLLPGILLDKNNGKFQISGISCPMDPAEFYDPIFDWFDEYVKDPLDHTVFDLSMTYYNTASGKFLLRILTNLNKLSETGHDVKVRWYYEEEDMKEEGEEFKNILSLDFEIISLNKNKEDKDIDEDFDSFMDDII